MKEGTWKICSHTSASVNLADTQNGYLLSFKWQKPPAGHHNHDFGSKGAGSEMLLVPTEPTEEVVGGGWVNNTLAFTMGNSCVLLISYWQSLLVSFTCDSGFFPNLGHVVSIATLTAKLPV